jgi:hypothetical protein
LTVLAATGTLIAGARRPERTTFDGGAGKRGQMKPLVVVGAVLIVLGGIVVALRGVSYVRDRQEVSLGPIEIAAEERGFISPLVGVIVLAAGVGLVLIGRRRPA